MAGRGHAPNRISNVISNQKRARLVEREADGSSTRSSFRVKEIGDDILGFPIGVTAAERHEDDLKPLKVGQSQLPCSPTNAPPRYF